MKIDVGTIVCFKYENADKPVVGQVVGMYAGDLEIKVFGQSDHIAIIKNFIRGYSTGALQIRAHVSNQVMFFHKTIVWQDRETIMYCKPNWIEKLQAFFSKGCYKKQTDGKVWRYLVKRKVIGIVYADGFFIPYSFEWYREPIYFPHYDKSLLWNKPSQAN